MLVKGHIPNLGPLGPLLHVKVCGGGGWVCKPILVIDLGPFPSSGRSIKGDTRTKLNTFFEREKEIIIFKICVIKHQLKSFVIICYIFHNKVLFIYIRDFT